MHAGQEAAPAQGFRGFLNRPLDMKCDGVFHIRLHFSFGAGGNSTRCLAASKVKPLELGSTLSKFGNSYRSSNGKALPMKCYTFYFMERFCRKVALPAIRTANHRDVFYYQQTLPSAAGFRDSADVCPLMPTNVTYHSILVRPHHKWMNRHAASPVWRGMS